MKARRALHFKKVRRRMNDRRQDLLNQLEATAKIPFGPEDFILISFQILYGLPSDLQLRAALHMGERYLPIFEKKQPGSTGARQILGDLDGCFRTERESTPDILDESDSADTTYRSGFMNLLVGYHHRDDPACLTAGACGMISHAIVARAQNVFLADDPVVIRLQKEHDAWWDAWGAVEEELWPPQPESFNQLWQPEHNSSRNVAFDAVYRRKWAYVAEWLRAEAVWTYPEPDDMEAMMRGLKRWESFECCPMWPERTEPESTGDGRT